jgi:hypothetical protein
MPIPALVAELCSLGESAGFDIHSLLAAANRNEAPAKWMLKSVVLPRLVERFNVSFSCAVHRFSDVQFPTGEPALPFAVGLSLLPSGQVAEAVRRQ